MTFNSSIQTSTCDGGFKTTLVSNPTHDNVSESMPCGHDTRNAPDASADDEAQGRKPLPCTTRPGTFGVK